MHGVAHGFHTSVGQRLDAQDFPPWSIEEAISYLERNCGLEGPLPGRVVEEHDEVFRIWRQLIEEGSLTTPFHVTHLDAHADMGMGDTGYVYVMTELLLRDPEDRTYPPEGEGKLNASNFVLFAVACRWMDRLTYVYPPGGGSDIPGIHKKGWDWNSDMLQLKCIDPNDVLRLFDSIEPEPIHVEPEVPLECFSCDEYSNDSAFDFITLARSPEFTPAKSDVIYDAIRERFIDEKSALKPQPSRSR